MRRIWAISALALVAAAPSQDAPLPVHVGGRVIVESGGALRFGWPGVYVEGRFDGTSVSVSAEPREEQLAVLIDGERRMVLTKVIEALKLEIFADSRQ